MCEIQQAIGIIVSVDAIHVVGLRDICHLPDFIILVGDSAAQSISGHLLDTI